MKALVYIIVAFIFCIPALLLANTKVVETNIPVYSDKIITERLFRMKSPIELRWNKDIKHSLNGYVIRGRKSTEYILGRASIYFPIFDRYLRRYHLPAELKYLAVIESALKPTIISPAGAGGLWQFMPATARKYGLKINDLIDERFDPQKSTEAAMKHLSYLYDKYENWTLAIAAYNCGSGRMDRSIQQAGSRDYDKVRKYLPRETVAYIRRFIAASYAMTYYLFHDIHPIYPDYNLQVTESVVIRHRKSFAQISRETGIEMTVIRKLNPAYKKEIIPHNKGGNFLILPIIGRNDAEDQFLTLKNVINP